LLEASYLGGVSGQVMADADCDVAVLIDRGLSRVEKVLLPYRGGTGDRVALRIANRLLRGGATVILLHVVPPDRAEGGPKLGASEALAGAFPPESAGAGTVEVRVVKHDDPLAAVLAEAGKGYDLLVVGCGEAWGLDRRLRLRPEELIHDSPVSLLVVSGSSEPGARQTTMLGMPTPSSDPSRA
jgi:nucleotide-binding universal stress UspA family protein